MLEYSLEDSKEWNLTKSKEWNLTKDLEFAFRLFMLYEKLNNKLFNKKHSGRRVKFFRNTIELNIDVILRTIHSIIKSNKLEKYCFDLSHDPFYTGHIYSFVINDIGNKISFDDLDLYQHSLFSKIRRNGAKLSSQKNFFSNFIHFL